MGEKKFKNSEEDYPKSINVKRLMSHTAGLDRHGIGLMPMGLERTLKGILLGDLYDWNGVNPIHQPGTVYDYSGGGYVAAEHLLELVTGETFTDWVTENLLDVIELENSTLETADDSMTNLPEVAQGEYVLELFFEPPLKQQVALFLLPMTMQEF